MGPTLPQPTIIGQMPLTTYCVMLLGFRVADVDRDSVIESLQGASSKLIQAFPFLGGQVVLEDSPATSGTYRTIPYEPHSKSVLQVKDCADACPSFDELLAARAPISMLDGSVLSPKKGFFHMYDPAKETLPVFQVQANFIAGGLLLCFNAEHNALDMTGQGQAIRLFAAACGPAPQPFSDAHITAGNLDGSTVFPFLGNGEKAKPHPEIRMPSSPSHAQAPVPPPAPVSAPWHIFRISHEKLPQLKREASLNPATASSWISTNDAVTALLWQRLTLARLTRFPDVAECNMIRAFGCRRLLSLPTPEGFMGNCPIICTSHASASSMRSRPLAALARELRSSIDAIDGHHVRSIASTIRDAPDRSVFSYGAGIASGLDVAVSSWAELGLQRCDFGPPLARAAFARRPALADAEGIVYVLPKTVDGDVELEASLRVDDVEALRNDPVWTTYVEFIG